MRKCETLLWLTLFMMALAPISRGGNPEKLLGVTLDNEKQEITIHVVSSGCTQKKDFTFEMKHDTLTVVRIKKDDCKAMESAAKFTYTLKEAGIDPNKLFCIRNKFVGNLFVAKI